MKSVPRIALRTVGMFNAQVRATIEMLYEFEEPFVVDSSKFAKAFGYAGTTLDEAADATVEWYRGQTNGKRL